MLLVVRAATGYSSSSSSSARTLRRITNWSPHTNSVSHRHDATSCNGKLYNSPRGSRSST